MRVSSALVFSGVSEFDTEHVLALARVLHSTLSFIDSPDDVSSMTTGRRRRLVHGAGVHRRRRRLDDADTTTVYFDVDLEASGDTEVDDLASDFAEELTTATTETDDGTSPISEAMADEDALDGWAVEEDATHDAIEVHTGAFQTTHPPTTASPTTSRPSLRPTTSQPSLRPTPSPSPAPSQRPGQQRVILQLHPRFENAPRDGRSSKN